MSSILAYEFMRNAFVASALVAIVCGAIGYFLVLRGEVFAGHALAHTAFPGATGAALLGIPPVLGLTVFPLLAGFGLSLLGERAHRDVAIGIVLAFSLGLGLLFLHFYSASAGAATALLFGNVLGIDAASLAALAGMSAACLLLLAFIARPLVFSSLQPELAEAKGLSLPAVSALFMVAVALAIAETIQIVGVLLVFALLVAPAATAARLTSSVRLGITVSIAAALAVAWASLVLAFYTDWPTSFWITALGTALYLASHAAGRGRRRLPRQKSGRAGDRR